MVFFSAFLSVLLAAPMVMSQAYEPSYPSSGMSEYDFIRTYCFTDVGSSLNTRFNCVTASKSGNDTPRIIRQDVNGKGTVAPADCVKRVSLDSASYTCAYSSRGTTERSALFACGGRGKTDEDFTSATRVTFTPNTLIVDTSSDTNPKTGNAHAMSFQFVEMSSTRNYNRFSQNLAMTNETDPGLGYQTGRGEDPTPGMDTTIFCYGVKT